MRKVKSKNSSETVSSDQTELTQEQIKQAALPPVNFIPDMSNVFAYAEKLQKSAGALSLIDTKKGIIELYAVTTPAVEMSLAVLAESAGLKTNWDDFFKPEAP